MRQDCSLHFQITDTNALLVSPPHQKNKTKQKTLPEYKNIINSEIWGAKDQMSPTSNPRCLLSSGYIHIAFWIRHKRITI